ncbi:MAG TPA: SCO family protein [Solirubrobacteraceae bacterium]|jgi:cytochrome oxidase Cu insertion factor (SCO1/SenC/PrrC family)|nr:SCO family protein [Solirubrobacteraceae bacterium]
MTSMTSATAAIDVKRSASGRGVPGGVPARVALALALALAALAVAAGALLPARARADGDPASDVLLTQSVFLPADSGLPAAQSNQLQALVREAAKDGYPIRVAVIPESYDLGSVTALWDKPSTYASFLGIELSLTYRGPLLVAMPDGWGFNWPGHQTGAADALLAKLRIAPGGAGLLDAVQTAVNKLAGSAGVGLAATRSTTPLSSPSSSAANGSAAAPQGGGDSSGFPLLTLAILAGSAAALTLLAVVVVPRRRVIVSRLRPTRRRLAMPGLVLVLGALVPVLIFAGPHPAATIASGSETPPVTWASGSRPAPNFRLRDQNGRPVSIAAFHGRPLIVTFIDPLCRELCPVAAQELSHVERQLPAAQRPEIIAVSVDRWGNARANLMQDFGKWHLVPQWRWAVGSPAQLASVWNRYHAEVDVTTKRIAGTTVHYITHSEMAYVIDGGDERALLSWPYTAREVERTVRSLT